MIRPSRLCYSSVLGTAHCWKVKHPLLPPKGMRKRSKQIQHNCFEPYPAAPSSSMPKSLLMIVRKTPKQNKTILIGEKSLTRFSRFSLV